MELTWKFVTQPCPIFVRTPKKFDKEVHTPIPNEKHWDAEQKDHLPVIYARPVVYRSYYGELLKKKGVVGNK